MVSRPAVLLAALGALAAPSARAQGHSVPSDTLLAGVTARGRALADYDHAAWHATDAILAGRSATELAAVANTMLAVQNPGGAWTVLWGRLSAAMDSFYVVFDARAIADPDSFVVRTNPDEPICSRSNAR
jgi:hypothetical protein